MVPTRAAGTEGRSFLSHVLLLLSVCDIVVSGDQNMPRTARKIGGSNIFHVMLRGINRQDIFEDDEDRLQFMSILFRCKDISGFRLHAFVLMSNHIHLLLEPAGESLDMVFRRIGTRYAVWYNRKYQRAGHLFQDRFRSENVETEQYYQTVLRYILQNPMKAGMEKRPGSYRWSSYLAYEKGKSILTDTQYALEIFGSREKLLKYVMESNNDSVMDEADHDWRLRDDSAKEIVRRITGCMAVADFQRFDLAEQKEFARKLYMERLSIRQIARMTGMSKSTVARAVKTGEDESPETEGLSLRESEENVYCLYADAIW